MKKLTLKLDDLAVDSFATHAQAAPRGTVLANADTDPQTTMAVDAGTLGCTIEPSGEPGYTCDRRCEPSIVCLEA